MTDSAARARDPGVGSGGCTCRHPYGPSPRARRSGTWGSSCATPTSSWPARRCAGGCGPICAASPWTCPCPSARPPPRRARWTWRARCCRAGPWLCAAGVGDLGLDLAFGLGDGPPRLGAGAGGPGGQGTPGGRGRRRALGGGRDSRRSTCRPGSTGGPASRGCQGGLAPREVTRPGPRPSTLRAGPLHWPSGSRGSGPHRCPHPGRFAGSRLDGGGGFPRADRGSGPPGPRLRCPPRAPLGAARSGLPAAPRRPRQAVSFAAVQRGPESPSRHRSSGGRPALGRRESGAPVPGPAPRALGSAHPADRVPGSGRHPRARRGHLVGRTRGGPRPPLPGPRLRRHRSADACPGLQERPQ